MAEPLRNLEPDSYLQAALRHAPDRDLQPPPPVSAHILAAARRAVAPPAIRPSWRERLAQIFGGTGRPALSGALGSLVLAGVIGLIWRDGPPPATAPDALEPPPPALSAPAETAVAGIPAEAPAVAPAAPTPATTATAGKTPSAHSTARNSARSEAVVAATVGHSRSTDAPTAAGVSEATATTPNPPAVQPSSPAPEPLAESAPLHPSAPVADPPAAGAAKRAAPAPAARLDAAHRPAADPDFDPLADVLANWADTGLGATHASRNRLRAASARRVGPWQAGPALPPGLGLDLVDDQGRYRGRLLEAEDQIRWQGADGLAWQAPATAGAPAPSASTPQR